MRLLGSTIASQPMRQPASSTRINSSGSIDGPSGGTVETRQVLPHACRVGALLARSEHVVRRDMRFDQDLTEPNTLRKRPGLIIALHLKLPQPNCIGGGP